MSSRTVGSPIKVQRATTSGTETPLNLEPCRYCDDARIPLLHTVVRASPSFGTAEFPCIFFVVLETEHWVTHYVFSIREK